MALKIGDTFEDGGVMHKGIGQNDSGLICQVIDGDIIKATKTEVVEEAVEEEANDYLSMPYAQLKKLCADRGIDATGKKSDLIARLEG